MVEGAGVRPGLGWKGEVLGKMRGGEGDRWDGFLVAGDDDIR